MRSAVRSRLSPPIKKDVPFGTSFFIGRRRAARETLRFDCKHFAIARWRLRLAQPSHTVLRHGKCAAARRQQRWRRIPRSFAKHEKRHFCQSPNQRLNCCDCATFSMDILIFESNFRTIPSEEVAAACRMLGNCTPSSASVAALFCGGAVKLYEVFESLSGASLPGCSARFFKICAACTYRRDQAS